MNRPRTACSFRSDGWIVCACIIALSTVQPRPGPHRCRALAQSVVLTDTTEWSPLTQQAMSFRHISHHRRKETDEAGIAVLDSRLAESA